MDGRVDGGDAAVIRGLTPLEQDELLVLVNARARRAVDAARPRLYGARASAAQAGVTGAADITVATELADTSANFASSALTVPLAGFVTVTITGTLTHTAGGAGTVTIGPCIATTLQGVGQTVALGVAAANVPFSVTTTFAVAAANVVRARVTAVSGGGTYTIDSATLTIQLFPS